MLFDLDWCARLFPRVSMVWQLFTAGLISSIHWNRSIRSCSCVFCSTSADHFGSVFYSFELSLFVDLTFSTFCLWTVFLWIWPLRIRGLDKNTFFLSPNKIYRWRLSKLKITPEEKANAARAGRGKQGRPRLSNVLYNIVISTESNRFLNVALRSQCKCFWLMINDAMLYIEACSIIHVFSSAIAVCVCLLVAAEPLLPVYSSQCAKARWMDW